MKVDIGAILGKFEILKFIGEGGMGQVYLAYDTNLRRKVALKFLAPKYSGDQERLRLFQEEARTASGLNNRYILTVYDTGQIDDLFFIATEFIEGETLQHYIDNGGLKLSQILEITIQAAEALSVAHKEGIIHRDIKPGNIMLHPKGYVKVLDFGLAKLIGPTDDDSKTTSEEESGTKQFVGTPRYMSPEQWQMRKLDRRTDIWSLGVVLYELITGLQPFAGTILRNEVINTAPTPLNRFVAEIPDDIQVIIDKTLSKSRKERYQTADELIEALKLAKRHIDPSFASYDHIKTNRDQKIAGIKPGVNTLDVTKKTPIEPQDNLMPDHNIKSPKSIARFFKGRKARVAGLAFFMAALLVGSLPLILRNNVEKPIEIEKTAQLTHWNGLDIFPSLSKDEKDLVYASDHNSPAKSKFEIYIKSLATQGSEFQVTKDGQQNFQPVWSADGQYIIYYSIKQSGIWSIPRSGGKPNRLTKSGSRPAVSPDGTLIAFQSDPITDLSATAYGAMPPSTIWVVAYKDGRANGEPKQLTMPNAPLGGHGSPSWSPDGKQIVFVTSDNQKSEIWSVSVNKEVNEGKESITAGPLKLIVQGPQVYDPFYSADGKSIFYINALRLVNFGLYQIQVLPDIGEPHKIIEFGAVLIRHPKISKDGKTIIYTKLDSRIDLHQLILIPDNNSLTSPSSPLYEDTVFRKSRPAFSPDGTKVAYSLRSHGTDPDIWQVGVESETQTPTAITKDANVGFLLGWSQDGNYIIYQSNPDEEGASTISRIDVNSGIPQMIMEIKEDVLAPRISPYSGQIAYHSKKADGTNVYTAPIDIHQLTPLAPKPLTHDSESMAFPCWSPDEKLIAFQIKRGESTYVGVVASDGTGNVEWLTDIKIKGQNWPYSWSPDKDKIAFAGQRNGLWNVYWVSRSTHSEKQLTQNETPNVYVRYPAWSPKDHKIIYERGVTNGNIFKIELSRAIQ